MSKKDSKKAEPENTAAENGSAANTMVEAPPVIKKKKKSFFKSKWFKRIIILLVIAAAVGAYIINKNIKAKRAAEAAATSNTSVVTRGDITVRITGSGTVQPLDTYNIIPTVSGTIDASYYEEGDYVEKDAVLYKFDSTQADNAIKTAQNNVTSAQNRITQAQTTLANQADRVADAQDDIKKLTIYATYTGKVSDMALTVGNDAGGRICTITDTHTLLVKIPFIKAYFEEINVGDSATINIEKYMRSVGGKVVRKYNTSRTGSDGSVVFDVEIQLDGGIELPEGTFVTASVNTASGTVTSSLAGTIYYPDPVAVNAEVSGKVAEIVARNGDWVQKGQVIARLESKNLQDALKSARQAYTDAQISLQEAQNSYQNALSNLEDRQSDADDYTITAPISGVVLSKSYKAGDTIYGMNSTTLMTIADMSKMKFTINVDELDIAKIAIGQEVEVTSDALEGVELVGYITNISKMGSSMNGVTNYPVEVTIDEPGDLMSGMNVSAEIIVGEVFDVIRVPVTAVSYFEGKHYVTVVGQLEGMEAGGKSEDMPQGRPGDTDGEMPEGGRPQGASSGGDSVPAGAVSMAPVGGSSRGNREDGNSSRGDKSAGQPNIVMNDKEERVEVTVGLSDDDYYEIKSGLTVGQVVRDNGTGVGGGDFFSMMMSGRMSGGGGDGGPGGGPGGGGPR